MQNLKGNPKKITEKAAQRRNQAAANCFTFKLRSYPFKGVKGRISSIFLLNIFF
jgi:hypothetical protein